VPEQPAGVLARNAFFLLLGQIGSTVLAIVLNATLARTLGAADFGVYFLLVTMSTFAYVVVEWGQSALVVREAARRPEATGELLGSALSFRVGVAALAVVATGLVTRLLGYDGRTQALSALMVFCSLPLALSQPYTYLFRGRDRMELRRRQRAGQHRVGESQSRRRIAAAAPEARCDGNALVDRHVPPGCDPGRARERLESGLHDRVGGEPLDDERIRRLDRDRVVEVDALEHGHDLVLAVAA